MIVACPTCHTKYSVQHELIGEQGKLVRCVVCGTTWQQTAITKSVAKKYQLLESIRWTFFWSTVLVLLFSLFFAKEAMVRLWNPMASFYDAIGMTNMDSKKTFAVKNVSNIFVKKKGKLFVGLKGELVNISNDVQMLPCITISLKDDESSIIKHDRPTFRKVWTHDLMYKKILPNQKIVFETEFQSVPYNNLICDIKLDAS